MDVRAYYNTGFNEINIPSSPDLLDEVVSGTPLFFYHDFPAIDLLQHTGLSSIKIKVNNGFKSVVDIDYVRISPPYTGDPDHGGGSGNIAFQHAYYFVDGVRMMNGDTAILSVTLDFINTAGGWKKLKFLDGITSRLSIKKTDDVFGRYTQDDPYITPNEDLVLSTENISVGTTTRTYVESTSDLGVMCCSAQSDLYSQPTSSADGADKVATPKLYPNYHPPTRYFLRKNNTEVEGYGGSTVVVQLRETGDEYETSDGVLISLGNVIQQGIKKCQALGMTETIIATAIIPTDLVEIVETTERIRHEVDDFDSSVVYWGVASSGTTPPTETRYKEKCGVVDEDAFTAYNSEQPDIPVVVTTRYWDVIDRMYGKIIDRTMSHNLLTVAQSGTYDNLRILYGEWHKNGILTNSGNRLEAKPEEIKPPSGGAVEVDVLGDPHLNGKPYFRFRYMHGKDGNGISQSFFENVVTGMQWKQIPLVYTEKAGNALDTINFEASRAIARDANNYDVARAQNALAGQKLAEDYAIPETISSTVGGAFSSAVSGLMTGGLPGLIFGGGTSIATGGIQAGKTVEELQLQRKNLVLEQTASANQYIAAANNEKRQFLTSQNVVAPTIQFPYNNDGYRDFFGDNALYYYYSPTVRDLHRMDKILTMYGYVTNEQVTNDIIDNRQNFVYIEANCSVGGNIPRWLANGVAMQISNGVRVWKVKPDPSYYEKGGNP